METRNEGHEHLLLDLRSLAAQAEALLAEATAFQFDDFKNEKYATPKVELDRRLREISVTAVSMAQRVRDGKYDQ